ncbi:hypothetical protein SSX86_027121 [Deinandra increscens subsp. villosa]|uniref:Uncharacterized protein n=1 Tax=Deinandra increscens subsp. villosa TaxID=3103831 RepID=A0AAP0CMP5_9ASTR
MKKLRGNDEAFHLSSIEICHIIEIIISRKTPTPKRYQRWDDYAISFYLKMCTCFDVDYQHLEASTSKDDCRKKQLSPLTKEMSSKAGQEEHMDCTTKGVSLEDLLKEIREEEHMDEEISKECRKKLAVIKLIGKPIYLRGPYKMGSYSPGKEPDCIPYHLYLLVREAVDIMKRYNNTNDLIDLKIAEKKIRFFCTYFNSHLPTGWKYNRANASFLIAGYDPTGGNNRCLMAGYTPFRDWAEAKGCDPKTYLSPRGIVDVMSIIHSRKTPTFWGMFGQNISFYCKLCSCFGIDYHRLEAASEDDVCLMNMGRNG